MKLCKKFILWCFLIITIINTYGLYLNISYIYQNPFNSLANWMTIFNIYEVLFGSYFCLKLYKSKIIELYERVFIFISLTILFIINTYYFIIDFNVIWNYGAFQTWFWAIDNLLVSLLTITIITMLFFSKNVLFRFVLDKKM